MRGVSACLAIGALCGCTNAYDDILARSSSTGGASTSSSAASTAASTGNGGAGMGSGGSGGGATTGPDPGGAGGTGGKPEPEVPVYFSTRTQLWSFDTSTHERTLVHDLAGCDDIEDIAVDEGGDLWANSVSGNLYGVAPNGDCGDALADQPDAYYTTGLGYAPPGVVDPEARLVGYDGAGYVTIDLAGTRTTIGAIGGGYAYGLDVVILDDTRGWAAVGEGPDCEMHCAVRIDPHTGAAQGGAMSFGSDGVYAIAWSAGIVYGFDIDGRVFAIDPDHPVPEIIAAPPGGFDDVWGAASPPLPP